MSGIDFDKLKEAINVVTRNQLKDNHDDTLVEKLTSCVEALRHHSGKDERRTQELLDTVTKNLEFDMPGSVYGTSLQLIGSMLSEEKLFDRNKDHQSLEKFVDLAGPAFASDDYSLQIGLIRGLMSMSSHEHGWKWVIGVSLSDDLESFPSLFHTLALNSKSFFVKNESGKSLVFLIQKIRDFHCSDESGLDKLRQVITSMAVNLNQVNLSLLKSLLGDMVHMLHRKQFARKYDLHDAAMREIDTVMSSPETTVSYRNLFCEVIALISDEEMAIAIMAQLVAAKNLRALITYTSRVLHSHPMSMATTKWLLYSIYPLIARSERRCELSSEFLASLHEREYVERLIDSSTLMHALGQLSCQTVDVISLNQLVLVFDSVAILLHDKLSDEKNLVKNRKLISEAISTIDRLAAHQKCSQRELVSQLITFVSDLLPITQDGHRLDLLKCLRKLLLNNLDQDVFEQVTTKKLAVTLNILLRSCRQLAEVLTEEEEDTRIEHLDSLLEVVNCLSDVDRSLFVTSCPELAKTCWSLWNLYKGHQAFRISAVKILIAIDFELSTEVLIELGLGKHKDIPNMLISFISANNPSLSLVIVESYYSTIVNSNRLLYLEEKHGDIFYKGFASAFNIVILTTVDTELQSSILKLWDTLLESMFSPYFSSREDKVTLSKLYTCGLFSVLYFLLTNELLESENIKVNAEKLRRVIKSKVSDEMNLTKQSFIELLHNAEQPEEVIDADESSLINEPPVGEIDKRLVVEQMFRGYLNQPTIDLIEELNSRQFECKEGHFVKKVSLVADTDKLADFIWLSKGFSPKACLFHEFFILDDILDAKTMPNAAQLDCY